MRSLHIDGRYEAKAHAEFHHAYGIALAQWAQVEATLYDWFAILTKMKDPMARGVFYSAKSFLARADMLEAAIAASGEPDPVKKFVDEVLKKARQYSTFRNTITHGEALLNASANDPTNVYFTLVQGKNINGPAVNVGQLQRAAQRFASLRSLALDMLPEYRAEHVQSPDEHLRLVTELPAEPHSRTNPTAQAQEPPPQSPHRNKKEYRAAQKAQKPEHS